MHANQRDTGSDDGTAHPAEASLLLLADGRFPAGAYAHSGGLEPLVRAGAVQTLAQVEHFLTGRARTVGLVGAAFAAAACHAVQALDLARVAVLDAELDARTPSPAQRTTSRQLGRQFLRVMMAIRPAASLHHLGPRPHQPLALGASCAVLEQSPRAAALVYLHDSVAGPAAAAVRLLSLNPFDVHAVLAQLSGTVDELATEADQRARGCVDDLPAAAAPMLDIAAEQHAVQAGRLFAS